MSAAPPPSHARPLRRLVQRIMVGAGLFIAALLIAGALYQRGAAARDAATLKPPGVMMLAGERTLHVHCVGDASRPLIVLENGMGVASEAWNRVQARLSPRYRVCAYDRSGTGWSPAAPGPHDAGAAADDLAALLQAMGVDEPVVVAGHSYGGVVARVFAERHPERVAALALVDSSHPDMGERLPPKGQAALRQLLSAFGMMRVANHFGIVRLLGPPAPWMDGLDGEARVRARALYASPAHMAGAAAEAQAWADDTSPALARSGASLGALPLTVITLDGYPAYALASWHAMQGDLARLSSQSRFVVISGADHYGLIQKPEFAARVADEVDLLAQRGRAPT